MHSRVPLIPGRASGMVLFASALSASLLCACGGSSPALLPAQAVSPASADSSDARVDAQLDLHVLIPRGSSHADYISRSTQSIVVTEGKRRLRPVNTVTPSRSCSVQSAGTLCVFHLGVLSGHKEVFVINTYDLKHGHGKLLSTGRITKRIRRGALNVLAVTLAGVPHSIELALQGAQLSVVSAGTRELNVMAKDADGNVIVGAGSYHNPIAIVTNDARDGYGIPVHGDRPQSSRYAYIRRTLRRKCGDRRELRRRFGAEHNRCDVRSQAHGHCRLLDFNSRRHPRTVPCGRFQARSSSRPQS